MTTGTQREYADHLDVSESYVSRLKRHGRLVFDGGLVDFEKSDALVAASRDPDRESQRDRWRNEKGSAAGDVAALASDVAALSGRQDREEPAAPAQPRASNELYDQRLRAQIKTAEREGQIKEIELHETAGSLMSVAVFKDRVHAYGRYVRDTFQGIEARMSPHLDSEQMRLLRQEIQTTLHELDRRVAAESRVKREAGATEPA